MRKTNAELQAAYRARRHKAGARRLDVWLTPKQLARLEPLAAGHSLRAIAKGLMLAGLDVVQLRVELAAARARVAQLEEEAAAWRQRGQVRRTF